VTDNPKTDLPGSDNLRLLDDLIRRCYDGLKGEIDEKPKVGDFLKMIELRRKLTPEDSTQKELWKLLEKARRDVLAKKDSTDNSEPDRLPTDEPRN